MSIRRHNVPDPYRSPWIVEKPPAFPRTGGVLDIRVKNPQGVPVSGALVALLKVGPGGGCIPEVDAAAVLQNPEFQANLYSDAQGLTHFQLPSLSPGTLYVTLTDDDANSLCDSITVIQSTGVGDGGQAKLQLTALPSITHGSTRLTFGRPIETDATLVIVDVAGREVERLHVAKGMTSVEWPGTSLSGSLAASGLYLAHLGGQTARILMVR